MHNDVTAGVTLHKSSAVTASIASHKLLSCSKYLNALAYDSEDEDDRGWTVISFASRTSNALNVSSFRSPQEGLITRDNTRGSVLTRFSADRRRTARSLRFTTIKRTSTPKKHRKQPK